MGVVVDTERLLSLLRGKKVTFHLIEGSTRLIEASLYPFNPDRIPMHCTPAEDLISRSAYTSGNRAIVLSTKDESWFKAKGIGIPSGNSMMTRSHGKLYTYYLSDTNIGAGELIWGLSTVSEAENEINRLIEARELQLPVATPIGIGLYKDVHVIPFKDRPDLFKMLNSTPREDLLKLFKQSSKPVEAACVFMAQPTDIRVDEILYGFLHPCIEKILDPRDCKDFVKWLGSSCGSNLRKQHDNNLLHGTTPRHGGFMTNSHMANHLVDERATYTTDYHLAYSSSDPELKRIELFFLAHVMNPLPRAYELAIQTFRPSTSHSYLEALEASPLQQFSVQDVSSTLTRYYEDQWFRPEKPQEKLTEAFITGLEHGYRKQRTIDIETKLRKEAMLKGAACKKELFHLLGLPEGMQRGIEVISKRLTTRSFTTDELKASLQRIEHDLDTPALQSTAPGWTLQNGLNIRNVAVANARNRALRSDVR